MKKITIFAASDQDIFLGKICSGYFFGYSDAALSKDKRLSIHNGLLHSCRNLSWSTCGKIAFPLLNILIFRYMTKTMKDCSIAKHSTSTATLFHETEALLKTADPQQAPQIILKMLQQLNGKVELHVHFIVNSVVVGNNISGSDIIISSYGHTSFGDNSSIDGQISKF
jgi:hypothetical protein